MTTPTSLNPASRDRPDPPPVNLGPTVFEAAQGLLWQTRRKIAELEGRCRHYAQLMTEYAGSQMLYSEYLATKAEVFQQTPLPEPQPEEKSDAEVTGSDARQGPGTPPPSGSG